MELRLTADAAVTFQAREAALGGALKERLLGLVNVAALWMLAPDMRQKQWQ